ncbi:hypothetical protein [Frankia canadensis]|uniref:hypothetical protein n=1 Tax=Frankia canadensis TaxID=1836972 RepID=UPI001FB027EF
MIDGATPLGGEALVGDQSPAAWLAATASAHLSRAAWAGRPIRAVLRELVEHVRDEGRRLGLGSEGGAGDGDDGCVGSRDGTDGAGAAAGAEGRRSEFPTATLSLVRQVGDRLELCLLGDSPVVLRAPGAAARTFTDPQFDGVEEALLARIHAELDRGVDAAEAYARERAASRERRARRNTPAGLWVLADEPAAAGHAFVISIAAPPGTEIAVMSDGYARCVHPFGLVADEDALLDELAAGRGDDLLDRLRAAENADPTRTRVPRFSRSDDATLLYARL